MYTAVQGDCRTMNDFTAHSSRRELNLSCAMGVLESLAGGLGEAAALQALIDVVAGDMARHATVFAQVASPGC